MEGGSYSKNINTMRKDIEIHINTGDITLTDMNDFVSRSFNWVSNPDGPVRYIYGEVTIPSVVTEPAIKSNGFYTTIPYTAKYKEFYIRVRRQLSENSFSYVQNPIDGSNWFLAQVGIYGKAASNAYASKLALISENSLYVKLNGGNAILYSASQSDLNIIYADGQNKNLLLKCNPTNSYRYPISGVGISRWINGTGDLSGLGERIKSEFADDGVVVKDVTYNKDTKELAINADTSED